MTLNFAFINEPTERFFNSEKRNACICGGFGSGKTYILCFKALFLLSNFNNYRAIFARQTFKDLKLTTLRTFEKICPPSFITRWDQQDGIMRFRNGSEAIWMHLDSYNEASLRGIEPNSVFIDQAEEIGESVYNVLDTRVGRWDKARPSKELLLQTPNWPKDSFGRWVIPNYMLLDCNPDTETHYIYRNYHPESSEYSIRATTHDYFEVSSTENPTLNPETLRVMLSRDPSWIKRFVYGQWGISEATIHQLLPDSLLDPDKEWIEKLIRHANLYRVLDHGEVQPSCCLWFAAFGKQFVCYREYYSTGLISQHRKEIARLSEGETYIANFADPQIFKMTSQKLGGLSSTSNEYLDRSYDAPPLVWQPADNNELATRNRINEYLALDPLQTHPLTDVKLAPTLYFIKRSLNHNYGCEQVIRQLRSQRRKKLGEINGKPIYSDEREMSVEDHAYDPLRYYIASHLGSPRAAHKKPGETSFLAARNRIQMLRQVSKINTFGDRRALA